MADQPATQRQLLEQNTDLTRLVYETVGDLAQRVNDGFAELRERLAHLEGQTEGENFTVSAELNRVGARTSIWVRIGIAISSALGIFEFFRPHH